MSLFRRNVWPPTSRPSHFSSRRVSHPFGRSDVARPALSFARSARSLHRWPRSALSPSLDDLVVLPMAYLTFPIACLSERKLDGKMRIPRAIRNITIHTLFAALTLLKRLARSLPLWAPGTYHFALARKRLLGNFVLFNDLLALLFP